MEQSQACSMAQTLACARPGCFNEHMYLRLEAVILKIFKVWFFLFCFAFLRHKCAVFRIESKVDRFKTKARATTKPSPWN
jgi:hypothetical protein